MRETIVLEFSSSNEFIEHDHDNSTLHLSTPNPLAYEKGIYKIPLPVRIGVPDKTTLMVRNYENNLLNGITVLKVVPTCLYWYSSIIIKVDSKLVVPKFFPLCELYLTNTVDFEVQHSHI